jgi:hypothetical protein
VKFSLFSNACVCTIQIQRNSFLYSIQFINTFIKATKMNGNHNKRQRRDSFEQRGSNGNKRHKSSDVVDEASHSSNSKPADQAKSRDCAYADNEFDVADILDFGKSLDLKDVSAFFL